MFPAPGFVNLILNTPLPISSSSACIEALSVALDATGDCTVNSIIEFAVTVEFVTAKSASAAAFKATLANVIIPEVALTVTPVLWSVACVFVKLPVCTIPFNDSVITKLPFPTVTLGAALLPATDKASTAPPLPLYI